MLERDLTLLQKEADQRGQDCQSGQEQVDQANLRLSGALEEADKLRRQLEKQAK
jgi:hypothetical protein